MERLCRLSDLKAYLGVQGNAQDEYFKRLLDGASQFVLSYLDKQTFTVAVYTENFKGNGKDTTLLRHWPALSIDSVGIAGVPVPEAIFSAQGFPTSNGYLLSEQRGGPQSLDLHGYYYAFKQPCRIVYRAGYEYTQSFLISSGDLTFFTTEGGQWLAHTKVMKNGVAMTRVSSAPAAGQYSVTDEGEYTFNTAENGSTVDITFSYCPFDVSQATMELAAELHKRKDRIGVESKSLSGGVGESINFTQRDMHSAIKTMLQPYKNVVPV